MKGRIMSAHSVASVACIFYARTKLCPLAPGLDTPRCKKLHSFRRNHKPLCSPHTQPPTAGTREPVYVSFCIKMYHSVLRAPAVYESPNRPPNWHGSMRDSPMKPHENRDNGARAELFGFSGRKDSRGHAGQRWCNLGLV
jgi:hypothetical protein